MSEREDAIKLANRILDRNSADPDDVLAILARQLIRRTEAASTIFTNVAQILDVVKIEWGKAWSAWDQEQRDSISQFLMTTEQYVQYKAAAAEPRRVESEQEAHQAHLRMKENFYNSNSFAEPSTPAPTEMDFATGEGEAAMDDKLKMSERMRRDYIGPGYLFPEWWIGEIADLETALASAQEENRKLRALLLVVDDYFCAENTVYDPETWSPIWQQIRAAYRDGELWKRSSRPARKHEPERAD